MNAPDYRTLLTQLESAKLILTNNAGDLNPADLRIRCLLNITANEAQRALLEANTSVTPAAAAAINGSHTTETAAVSQSDRKSTNTVSTR
jgi:hypothetical protein